MMSNKRMGEFEYDDGVGKKARSSKTELRFIVPSKMAGSLIGKGGANITQLREEFGVSVRIPDCPGPERILNISGDNEDSCVGCLRAAIPFMYDCPGGEDDGKDRELRFLIHQSVAGGVIGKSGSKVKEIRENTGANVKVFSSHAPQSTDRCVQINGTLDKVMGALIEIMEVVNASEVKGSEQHYDPLNFDAFYANEYGGFGGGGEGPRSMRGSRGGPMGMRGMRGGPPAYGFGGPGGPGGFDDAYGGFGPPPMGRGSGFGGVRGGSVAAHNFGRGGNRFGGNDGGWAGPGFPRGGGGGGHGGPSLQFKETTSDGQEDGETTQVTIPNELAGAIIGPGGQRIRKVRNDSRAQIVIGEPDKDTNERIITISGDQRAIQTAQYLLQQSVRENASGFF